jgi:hypothetical protein
MTPDPLNPPIEGGPFKGWTSQDFDYWHQGQGFGQLNYPSFTGNTAGPGGQNLAYETTSYNVPGVGWVPRAQLANSQASNNLWDYMNPFGHTSEGGSGTGGPTQRNVGRVVGTATNMIIPGLGFVTGPIARYVTSLFQKNPNASPQQIKAAVQQAQQEQKLPPMPSGSVPLPNAGGGYQPSSLDPFGNPTTGREWWSSDFGRDTGGSNAPGGYNLAGPGGGMGQRGTGFGSGTVGNWYTALGFGGQGFGGGGISANAQALGGGALARHAMEVFRKTGYLAPTQALVGGPPPGMLQGTQAGGYMGNIVNPAAFGSGFTPQGSIHMRPRAEQ